MRIPTAALLLVALLLALVGLAAAAPVAAGSGDASGPTEFGAASFPHEPSPSVRAQPGLAASQSDAEANETYPVTIDIQVRENGDALVEIRQEFPNATPAEQAAFEDVAFDFRNEQYDLGYGAFQSGIERADPAIERDLSVSADERTVRESGDTASLVLRFTVTNFANVTEDSIEVGDVFHTPDGLSFRTLDRGDELVIRAPEGYTVTDSPGGPRIENGEAVIWSGEERFDEETLWVVFSRETSSNLGTYLLLGAVGLVVLAVGAFMLYREGSGDRRPRSVGADPVNGLLRNLPWAEEDVDGPASDGGGTTPTPPMEPAEEPVDPELLSDEERVEWLLEQNGGRMKQSNIVSETGWSNAKVSQLLSGMDDDGRVDKLRIGRENLITLPDEDVTDSDQ